MERFRGPFFGESGKAKESPDYCCQDPFGRHRNLAAKGWTPNTDIFETADAVVLLLEVAGMTRDDIQIIFHQDILRVTGNRTRRNMQGTERIHRMAIDYGPFEKLFRIPRDLDANRIEAEYEQGMLRISLPKKKDAPKEPIKIVVHEE